MTASKSVVKGKRGGARPNSGGPRINSGGARAGAGRPRKVAAPVLPVVEAVAPKVAPKTTTAPAIVPSTLLPPLTVAEAEACRNDPLEFLRAVWAGRQDASPTQIRAAAAALPFLHKKLGEGGKKDQTQRAAEKVASRFAPVAPPRLIASNDK